MNYPTYEIEESLMDQGYEHIVGVDEVGRGPGAGPVVAAAVCIPIKFIPQFIGRVKDSKKMTVLQRNKVAPLILEMCDVGTGMVSNKIIDEVNILKATKLAMCEAIEELANKDFILVDGDEKMHLQYNLPQSQVPQGDSKSISIAAASIVAKIYRDKMMVDLHKLFPEYGWKRNKGYLTKEHIQAIKTYGITEYHRQSFRKVGR